MKTHYWTNAIMHGASKTSGTRDNLKFRTARKACTKVLKAQITALLPKIIIANGLHAANSLKDIGLIEKEWQALKRAFNKGAYKEKIINCNGEETNITVFCTYHTSAGVINRTLSDMYEKDAAEIEECINQKIQRIPSVSSAEAFLRKYSDLTNARNRGMRFLLNHWLDIGAEIRAVST